MWSHVVLSYLANTLLEFVGKSFVGTPGRIAASSSILSPWMAHTWTHFSFTAASGPNLVAPDALVFYCHIASTWPISLQLWGFTTYHYSLVCALQTAICSSYVSHNQKVNPHTVPLNYHFPMLFLWFSWQKTMVTGAVIIAAPSDSSWLIQNLGRLRNDGTKGGT